MDAVGRRDDEGNGRTVDGLVRGRSLQRAAIRFDGETGQHEIAEPCAEPLIPDLCHEVGAGFSQYGDGSAGLEEARNDDELQLLSERVCEVDGR